jgi:CheY-like chemotaxis protein
VPNPILIVEDDEPTQKLLQAVLRHAGHASEVAGDGGEAIELLRERRFAAIVLDLMMPSVGGSAVVDFVAQMAEPIPIVICSAAGVAALTGFDPRIVKAVIRKPFDVDEFVAIVKGQVRAPERVLVIEDDERARYVLRSLLEPAEVVEAESGEQALELLRQQRFDVVVLDLILPGSSGEEILRELGDVPVIVISSRRLGADQSAPLLGRAAAFIYKGELTRETLGAALALVRKHRG